MRLIELTSFLEGIAPLGYQESYDNAGLIVGDPNREITQAIVSLDCTEEVIEEAIAHGANLVVSHHPIVFKGLKKFSGSTYVERVVMKAIKHDIALYAIHTNLDNVLGGVNGKIAEKLGLEGVSLLAPKEGIYHKLAVFVPHSHADILRNALFAAGAGEIGKYSECSYNLDGYGTYKPSEGAQPYLGDIGLLHKEPELKIEVIYPTYKERAVLIAMYEYHPYEEIAYDIFRLENRSDDVGSGVVGNLPMSMGEQRFLAFLKERMNASVIRHTAFRNKPVQRVAVCGGAGGFLLQHAIRSGADAFVTADYKYHEFFDAEGKTLIADIGHFESEQFTQELLLEIIQKKFPNFAVRLTGVNTNPIKYYV
ncbi:Nif3-like dinuclear metal center hexameric protein [Olivibacter sitiensis]|uniref:Nif3-like dinuclear metal center hexameric protein n=1 Tax=Olivibacter sitiensis TaxID=376470 RepID=UPI0003F6C8E1|nr:Nif3-like dinuclear metal center hexameric protein [Olivibacter sitiensis]